MKTELEAATKSVDTWQKLIDYEKRLLGYADPAHVKILEMEKERLVKLQKSMKKNRARNYRTTVNNDAEGKAELNKIRLETKIFNAEEKLKALKDSSYRPIVKRISVYGRLGKNNPNAHKYRTANRYSFNNAYARIRIEDAATLDIYVTACRKVIHDYSGQPFVSYKEIYDYAY
jgi:hypothetical protein